MFTIHCSSSAGYMFFCPRDYVYSGCLFTALSWRVHFRWVPESIFLSTDLSLLTPPHCLAPGFSRNCAWDKLMVTGAYSLAEDRKNLGWN